MVHATDIKVIFLVTQYGIGHVISLVFNVNFVRFRGNTFMETKVLTTIQPICYLIMENVPFFEMIFSLFSIINWVKLKIISVILFCLFVSNSIKQIFRVDAKLRLGKI